MNSFLKNPVAHPNPIKFASLGAVIELNDAQLSEIELSLSQKDFRTYIGGFYRRQILSRLGTLQGGRVCITEGEKNSMLASPAYGNQNEGLEATVNVFSKNFFKRTFWGGTIGAAESYIDGEWGSDNLTDLIRIMIRNLDRFQKLEKSWAYLTNQFHFWQHRNRKNSITGSRKNIHEHYDLGNSFYSLFLDETMSYSSGIFELEDPNGSDRFEMVDASHRKLDAICQKLALSESDHLLEIGTGWGGLAIHAATHYGCKVTTCTISSEQFLMANERVRKAGLGRRVEVLFCDYRELEGQFDKIVSVEMIEAVGHEYFDQFFAQCKKLLKPGGDLLLQAITIGEQDYDHHIRRTDFIRKYIFPGGCLPSISALSKSVGRVTDMRMTHQRDITPHYVKTLKYWRSQFLARLEDVRNLGYSNSFIRLWNFYLCYCEAAFAERRVHCVHLVYSRPE
ncbi:MAG: cyclopropane-fatty-acyl-phospholipid synthase family protein [Planctomycetota bacterium]